MRPRATVNDMADHAFNDTVLLGDALPRPLFGGAATTYFDYLGFRQLCLSVFTAARVIQSSADRMVDVFHRSHVFEIFRAIVSLVSVFVVDVIARRSRSDEGSGNKGMNARRWSRSIAPRQVRNDVSTLVGPCRCKDATAFSAMARCIPSHPPKIRHRVPPFVPNDRLPDFCYNGFRHGRFPFERPCLGSRGVPAPRRPALYRKGGDCQDATEVVMGSGIYPKSDKCHIRTKQAAPATDASGSGQGVGRGGNTDAGL